MAQPKNLQDKNLSELSRKEWESLCNHCGVCCLHKVLDVETGDVYTTRVVCEFYDLNTGQCSVYDYRFRVNPGCTKITPGNIAELSWLPNSCNYRRAYEKRALLKTHPFSGKAPKSPKKRLEQILGYRVVVYREGMDISDYIILCQCG